MAYSFTTHDLDRHELDWSIWLWLAIASVMFLIVIYALINSGSPFYDVAVTIEGMEMVP